MGRVKTLGANAGWLIAPFLVVGTVWEIVARAGIFPPKLFPSLATVFEAFVRLSASGLLWANTEGTLVRLALGFLLAAVVGVLLGIAMGRYRLVEDVFLPLVSIGYPIPGLAYAPLFVLWFGLGDLPTILLVGVASSFAVIINTWKGVRAVNKIWIRAAEVMGASDRQLFRHVILPGSLPYILTGMRLGLAQAWRILVAVEMLTAVPMGLGWMIFGAQEFLNTDVMLAGVAAIGIIGLLLEKQVFERLERYTVVRWGMLTA
ncbi:MAG: ABC transporter permease [Betaproteobacteria bacterium]